MTLLCQIGVLPAMRRLSLPAYVDAFRAMDFYLDRSMPPYKMGLLLVNLAACVLLALQHHRPLAITAGVSFSLNVLALILTIRKQLPLNARLKGMEEDDSEALLLEIRDQTIRNFFERFIVSGLAFAVLCAGLLWWPLR